MEEHTPGDAAEASTTTPSEIDVGALLRVGSMVNALVAELRAMDALDSEEDLAAAQRICEAARNTAIGALDGELASELQTLVPSVPLGGATGANLQLTLSALAGWCGGLLTGGAMAVAAAARSAQQPAPATPGLGALTHGQYL